MGALSSPIVILSDAPCRSPMTHRVLVVALQAMLAVLSAQLAGRAAAECSPGTCGTSPPWVQDSIFSFDRSQACEAAYDHRIFTYFQNTLRAFDTSTSSWSVVNSNGVDRYTGACVVSGTDFYYVGGLTGNNQFQSTIFRYSVPSDTWTPVANLPVAEHLLVVAADATRLWVGGGNFNPTWMRVYNIGSWMSVAYPNLPTTVHNGFAVYDEVAERLYVGLNVLYSIDVNNPSAGWMTLTPPPVNIREGVASMLGGAAGRFVAAVADRGIDIAAYVYDRSSGAGGCWEKVTPAGMIDTNMYAPTMAWHNPTERVYILWSGNSPVTWSIDLTGTCTLVVNTPPVITTPPVGGDVARGAPLTLTCAASGEPAPTYAWEKDDAPCAACGTSATLSVASADTDDAGSYKCVATNSEGSAESDAAVVTVCTAAGPPPDAGTIVSAGVSVQGVATLEWAARYDAVSFAVELGSCGTGPAETGWTHNLGGCVASHTLSLPAPDFLRECGFQQVEVDGTPEVEDDYFYFDSTGYSTVVYDDGADVFGDAAARTVREAFTLRVRYPKAASAASAVVDAYPAAIELARLTTQQVGTVGRTFEWTLVTSVQYPYRLVARSADEGGADFKDAPGVQIASTDACADTLTGVCVQDFTVTATAEDSVCSISAATITALFDVECRDPSVACDTPEDATNVPVQFTVSADDFCPTVVEVASVRPTLTTYGEATMLEADESVDFVLGEKVHAKLTLDVEAGTQTTDVRFTAVTLRSLCENDCGNTATTRDIVLDVGQQNGIGFQAAFGVSEASMSLDLLQGSAIYFDGDAVTGVGSLQIVAEAAVTYAAAANQKARRERVRVLVEPGISSSLQASRRVGVRSPAAGPSNSSSAAGGAFGLSTGSVAVFGAACLASVLAATAAVVARRRRRRSGAAARRRGIAPSNDVALQTTSSTSSSSKDLHAVEDSQATLDVFDVAIAYEQVE